MSVTPDFVKRTVAAQLDRLNMRGAIASISDAILAVRRLQERKVAETFQSIFSDWGLEDLEVARATLSDMFPKLATPSYQTLSASTTKEAAFKAPPASITPPPAPAQSTKKKGGKR